jgi:hypothetical protein
MPQLTNGQIHELRRKMELSMNTVVIEHVAVADLPEAWRAKLAKPLAATVTVRIEEAAAAPLPAEEFVTDDPAFGIWRDREDMTDVTAYIRKIREPRFRLYGTRNES